MRVGMWATVAAGIYLVVTSNEEQMLRPGIGWMLILWVIYRTMRRET